MYRFGRLFIALANSIVDMAVLVCLLLLIAVGAYGLWDNELMVQGADQSNYAEYQPTENPLSFQELQKLNPDVFGWLEVYGTNINYPLLQGEDNDKYVHTDVMGNYSASGSLFLDYRNQPDFSDFNSIIYGHHMEKQAMFGELSQFLDDDYFKEHAYGEIYFDGKTMGIKFVAFLEADAYDWTLYTPGVQTEGERTELISRIKEYAAQLRDFEEVSTDSHLIFLSTCTSDVTNGRHILIGQLGEELYEDPFTEADKN